MKTANRHACHGTGKGFIQKVRAMGFPPQNCCLSNMTYTNFSLLNGISFPSYCSPKPTFRMNTV